MMSFWWTTLGQSFLAAIKSRGIWRIHKLMLSPCMALSFVTLKKAPKISILKMLHRCYRQSSNRDLDEFSFAGYGTNPGCLRGALAGFRVCHLPPSGPELILGTIEEWRRMDATRCIFFVEEVLYCSAAAMKEMLRDISISMLLTSDFWLDMLFFLVFLLLKLDSEESEWRIFQQDSGKMIQWSCCEVVTNCSDQHRFRDMAKIFKGLCMSGLLLGTGHAGNGRLPDVHPWKVWNRASGHIVDALNLKHIRRKSTTVKGAVANLNCKHTDLNDCTGSLWLLRLFVASRVSGGVASMSSIELSLKCSVWWRCRRLTTVGSYELHGSVAAPLVASRSYWKINQSPLHEGFNWNFDTNPAKVWQNL